MSAIQESAGAGPLSTLLAQTRSTRTLVEALLVDPASLGPDFTAIRRLVDGSDAARGPLLGWKATGRGTPGTAVADTLSLLDEARRLGLVERLDWAFRCHTFRVAIRTPISGELHLTPEPETFGTPCPPRLAVDFLRGRQTLQICAELHDDAFNSPARLRAAVSTMRRDWGWRLVVVDLDADVVEPALDVLEWIRPAYVHLDMARRTAPGPLQTAALELGAELIAVNVDTPDAVDSARTAGARYVRGLAVGAARPLPSAP